tara:strand:- start:54 stop:176 length:123 start_codon:yes stop_codon:yes gene_type:complete
MVTSPRELSQTDSAVAWSSFGLDFLLQRILPEVVDLTSSD